MFPGNYPYKKLEFRKIAFVKLQANIRQGCKGKHFPLALAWGKMHFEKILRVKLTLQEGYGPIM